jgi:agmatinase
MLPESPEVRTWHEEARSLVLGLKTSEAGDATRARQRVNELSAQVNARVYTTARDLIQKGHLVATLGGDHSTPFGAIRAHGEAHPGLGILHVDAHADLRDAYEGFVWSHASIMHNVMERVPEVARIVQVGIRDFSEGEHRRIQASNGRVVTFFDADLAEARFTGETWGQQVARIVAELPRDVYVSFDIDGLEPTLCPHTGTPVPGGLSFNHASTLIAALAGSGRRIVGVDITEIAPGPNGDEWDGNVGARVLYKLIAWMLKATIG